MLGGGLAIGATVAWAGMTPLVVFAGIFLGPSVGVALSSIPVALTVASVVFGIYAEELRQALGAGPRTARGPVMVGPGFVMGTF